MITAVADLRRRKHVRVWIASKIQDVHNDVGRVAAFIDTRLSAVFSGMETDISAISSVSSITSGLLRSLLAGMRKTALWMTYCVPESYWPVEDARS